MANKKVKYGQAIVKVEHALGAQVPNYTTLVGLKRSLASPLPGGRGRYGVPTKFTTALFLPLPGGRDSVIGPRDGVAALSPAKATKTKPQLPFWFFSFSVALSMISV